MNKHYPANLQTVSTTLGTFNDEWIAAHFTQSQIKAKTFFPNRVVVINFWVGKTKDLEEFYHLWSKWYYKNYKTCWQYIFTVYYGLITYCYLFLNFHKIINSQHIE